MIIVVSASKVEFHIIVHVLLSIVHLLICLTIVFLLRRGVLSFDLGFDNWFTFGLYRRSDWLGWSLLFSVTASC